MQMTKTNAQALACYFFKGIMNKSYGELKLTTNVHRIKKLTLDIVLLFDIDSIMSRSTK